MEPRGGPLYKVAEGEPALEGGVPWADVDRRDGFVHLSAAHQLRETLVKHFAHAGRMTLLEIDPARLTAGTLQWEVSRGGDHFPHVHGDIAAAAVVGVDAIDGPTDVPGHVAEPIPPDARPGPRARRLEAAEVATFLSLGRAAPGADVTTSGHAVRVRFPYTSVIDGIKGFGIDPPTEDLLDDVPVEVYSHAAPETFAFLAARGYRATHTENILVRPLVGDVEPIPGITLVDASPDLDAYADLLAEGFGIDEARDDARNAAAAGQSRPFFIVVDGVRVGVCSMRIDHEVALMTGSTVLPPYRGRGYHTAAIAARLHTAHRLGCRYAKQDVDPGSTSHNNAHRSGFVLSHTRTSFSR